MSHFKSDLHKESILSEFLDAQYIEANLNMFRIKDLSLQHKGVDLIFYRDAALSFKIDEKAQLHYLNKGLPTFALEIDYLKDEIQKKGWLFNTHKITEIYAFIFSIYLKNNLTELKKVDDILSCDLIFVNRLRLINELSLLGINHDLCKAKSKQLRMDLESSKLEHPSGFNFQISRHLEEQPVNLIVRKSFLEKIGQQYLFKAKIKN
ncbi:hypothetical protein I5M32_14600 [Pedobacter sp. SD-b]|uniref:Uncharacterized protein n=1 Tax=Pedobacter segetis TaxID=2793069 RepID=A0ABS1BMS7_9SPHI|nr:hypothetical protein [Pedobacter segetis]MBK0384195.1 hypothetical protein [Pedobacter segetis]